MLRKSIDLFCRFTDPYSTNKWTVLLTFTFMWPCIVTNFFIIKPTRCTNFTNLFWHETLHVSDSSFRAGPRWNILVLLESYLQTCMTYSIAECTVNSWWWTEGLSETCRVSCQNKFVKLVHLVGFTRIIKKSYSSLLRSYIIIGFDFSILPT